ncbi:MAG TPA: penicillin acylase family protein, partial [Myxococcota bacterium]|nr:penicillin acylase family protein [Myxococcota bacterium]
MIPLRVRRNLGAAVALAAGVAVAVVLLVGGIRERWAARAAFPDEKGDLRVVGLSAPVAIFRDEHGIAHAEAHGREDAFFALGFVHGQDRLAQMYWLARLARGRTAEVIGAPGLPADRLARALQLGAAAEGDFGRLSPAARAALEAYAKGVNAAIAELESGHRAPPLAVRRLDLPLEPWRPSDSLA